MRIRDGRLEMEDLECSTTVDSQGAFQCQKIRSGVYAIVVKFPQTAVRFQPDISGRNGLSYLPLFMFYPPNLNLDPANLIRIRDGENFWADIQVDSDSLSTLQVKVPSDAVNGDIRVYLKVGDFKVPILNNLDLGLSSTGDCRLSNIPAGTYTIIAEWTSEDSVRKATGSVTTNQISPSEVSLAEIDISALRGTVKYQDKSVTRASEVILTETCGETGDRYTTRIKSDGTFAFKNVAAG